MVISKREYLEAVEGFGNWIGNGSMTPEQSLFNSCQLDADVNFSRPQTRDEMRMDLQEDNRMSDDEIEEWLDSLEQQDFNGNINNFRISDVSETIFGI